MARMNTNAHVSPGTAPAVLADRVDIGYSTEPIVAHLSLRLERGQSLAIMGMNGSGKSTLLKTLVGLLPAQGGRLDVLGTRAGAAPRRLAYLSQFHNSDFILAAARRGCRENGPLSRARVARPDDAAR